ncbi:MAG: FAD-binding protein [Hyphomicrobiales bacterium]|nr:FAD-binding protein [Hyphomicrobiales bacterium]
MARAGTTIKRKKLVAGLSRLVPARALIASDTGRMPYRTDGFQHVHALPMVVVLPESTEQVQAVLRFCHESGVAVIPRGAGTNLTGGTVPVGDCVTVATNRMRRILEFDGVSGTVRVEAGVRNLAVSEHVQDKGWFYAPDPSSRRTCTIGGNIATNSGGAACLRHGVTVNNVAGATLVLCDGKRVEIGVEAYETEGYDFTGLICGSEGQLGLVTEATLRLVPAPAISLSVMLAFGSANDAISASSELLAAGILPRQLDFMDGAALRLCQEFCPSGYPVKADGLLLVQLDGLPEEIEAQSEMIRRLMHRVSAINVARTPEAEEALWRGRMKIYGAAGLKGAYISLDCAVPLSRFADVIGVVERETGRHGVEAATALHAGDGTVHAFLFHDKTGPLASQKAKDCAEAIRHACIRMGGSISSEYGIGLRNRDLMATQFTSDELALQRRCLDVLQRGSGFNPGKVFPKLPEAAE